MENVSTNVIDALRSMDLWIMIAKSVLIILLGYALTRLKLLPDKTDSVLTKVVMIVALPCLAFASFMTSIKKETFTSCIFSFFYGFVIYAIFILLAKLLFRYEKNLDTRQVLEMLFVFGSTTFFAQPLIEAVFKDAYNDSSMFNIPFRVYLYSYCYYELCIKKNYKDLPTDNLSEKDETSKKLNKKEILRRIFLNPIIIATFLGFILWSLQLVGDTTDKSNWWVVSVNGSTGAFWNIKISLPWLYQTINTLGQLASPLVWISIGCTLGKVPFKEAAKDKNVWIYSFVKLIVGPLVNLLVLFLLNLIPGLNITNNTVIATTLMWAVPPAVVATLYSTTSGKGARLASSTSLITTFVPVLFLPIYIIVLTIISNTAYFH